MTIEMTIRSVCVGVYVIYITYFALLKSPQYIITV